MRGSWKIIWVAGVAMNFEFRLQRVLNYREDQKRLAEEELSRRQRELDLLQEELDALLQKELKLLNLCRERLAKAVDIQLLGNIESYRIVLQGRVESKRQERQEYCSRVEEQRQVVIDSWRSCQVLEKLKEKNLMDYRQEEKMREQRFNDEISLQQYLSKRG